MNDEEQVAVDRALLSRRSLLKFVAGAPLVATFGFVGSPLLRYLKPTMEPGNFCQAADLPKTESSVIFHRRDFPAPWTCIPFLLPMKYVVFGPERYEIRKEPGFIIRTAGKEIVAYSRICTGCRHRQPINFISSTVGMSDLPQSKTPEMHPEGRTPCRILTTLDAGGGAYALYGGDTAECSEPFRRKAT